MSAASVSSGDRLTLTLFVAAAFHAIAILGLGFELPDMQPADDETLPTMDVTLVHSADEQTPEEADLLAQKDQVGGGEKQSDARPGSPADNPAVQEPGNAPTSTPAAAPPEQSRPQPRRETLTAEESPRSIVRQPQRQPQPEQRDITAAELMERSREYASLSAEIRRLRETLSENPREKYISANTREYKYASYMDAWRSKVERVGNLNYPEEARRQGLSGRLLMDVVLEADGSVTDVKILRSSGNRLLDDAAVRIVRLAAPFPEFPENIREDFDRLHITRTWVFDSEGGGFDTTGGQ
ncbi:protein TonB [Thiohalospira halophila DSM 15071]|uniref:Protein TonB n=1 Tax=Thiohalospira halophila DSM 15071 TaxID=1123397 RepID=A0A1I1SGY5_9GAMM|nr:energy transducer TonB [Thiohalospira halophila]SFD45716.1 protein TonB [Thiohalospira halophila DSM 15071]